MALDPAELVALKLELDTDPTGQVYSAVDREAAEQLNLRDHGVPADTLEPEFVNASQLQRAVDGPEMETVMSGAANTWKNLMWLSILTASQPSPGGGSGVPIGDANLRAQVVQIWPGDGPTRANLVALQTRPASRAEVLFGENATVGELDVNRARQLP